MNILRLISIAKWHLGRRSTRIAVFAATLLVVVFISYEILSPTKAETLTLHPTACLGGWNNAANAQGEPETGNDPLPEKFTDNNSAVLPANTSAEVYCGGFTGEIPPDTKPRTLVLQLSLSTGKAPQAIIGNDFASSSGQVLDAPEGSTLEIKQPAAPSQDAAPVVPTNPEPVPTPEAPPAPAPDAVSFIERFTPTAHAQSDVPDTTPAPLPADTAPAAPSPSADGRFLEVRYTFDGKTWQTLDTLDAAHSVSQSYTIPLPSSTSWKDLSAFQVSLRSLPSVDMTPKVYLDGMTFSVGYGPDTPVVGTPSDPILPEDYIYYHVADGIEGNKAISARIKTDGEQDIIVLHGRPGTNFRVYKLTDPTFALSVGVGDGDVELPTYLFGAGDFAIVDTNSPDACALVELLGCRSEGNYLGELDFTMVLERPTASTTPGTASSTPANASSSPPSAAIPQTPAAAADATLEPTI